MVWNIPLSDQAMRVFGIYIGLLLLLIILGVALMYLCYKVCNKQYQQSADEKEPNEKKLLTRLCLNFRHYTSQKHLCILQNDYLQ